MAWLKRQIADCAAEKSRLTYEMENWYSTGTGHNSRFPAYPLLDQVNARLSRLDSSYQPLWNHHRSQSNRMY